MDGEKLLDVEPQELSFLYELRKQDSCTVRLSNNSQEHVAFKVMSTNPRKYTVRPKMGVLLPKTSCDVKVTMAAPKEAPSRVQCKDKFLIKSVVASPGDTAETSQRLFNGREYIDGDCRLKVVYIFPSRQQSSNLERSRGEGSSRNTSTVQETSLGGTELKVIPKLSIISLWLEFLLGSERQDRNGRHVIKFFVKGITIVFLCLIFWFLIMKMLSLAWSFTFLIITFVVKLVRRQVSDSIEDWIEKIVLYICIHLFSFLFRRGPDHGSRVSNVG